MIDHLDKIYGEKKESVERYKKLYSVKDLSEIKDVDAVALASVLHYDLEKISNIKEQLSKIGVHCRK